MLILNVSPKLLSNQLPAAGYRADNPARRRLLILKSASMWGLNQNIHVLDTRWLIYTCNFYLFDLAA